ncbi:MAG: glycoside hydrolase family 127 protein [Clostridia bacterium]|nr:glycoside hydrolase family 127 protein [Clostridia bacterium]
MKTEKFVPFQNVKLNDGFWKSRYDLNKYVSIRSVRDRFEDSGRMDALRFNFIKNGKRPHYFYDSDVAKWIEGVAYIMETDRASMAEHEKLIDELVDRMAEAQRDDGYLNSYFQQLDPDGIFQNRDRHELYCIGHIIEAAVAYYHATGKDKLLKIAERMCDCVWEAFFEKKTAAFSTPGHEEIELALYRLYECTGKERYREMAEGFLTRRGNEHIPDLENRPNTYAQDDSTVYSVSDVQGHSVRAFYLYCGAADMAYHNGDKQLMEAMKRAFYDVVERKMYITGGTGSTNVNEGFTVAYDLPNADAYSESCAAIALALFAMRLRRLERCADYGDVIERVLYNNGLSSTSQNGKEFFYSNPLEIRTSDSRKANIYHRSHKCYAPIHERVEDFKCSCCPPNINRFFAFFPELICVDGIEGACIEQYIPSEVSSAYGTLSIAGDYAVNGKVTVSSEDYKATELLLRVPAWCKTLTAKHNGKEITAEPKDGYLHIIVPSEFTLELDFHIAPTLVAANPEVSANVGRAALTYGPVVYCLEGVDNGGSLNRIILDSDSLKNATLTPDFHGLLSIETDAHRLQAEKNSLYLSLADLTEEPVRLKWIPYFAFANRGESDMLVWVRVR